MYYTVYHYRTYKYMGCAIDGLCVRALFAVSGKLLNVKYFIILWIFYYVEIFLNGQQGIVSWTINAWLETISSDDRLYIIRMEHTVRNQWASKKLVLNI